MGSIRGNCPPGLPTELQGQPPFYWVVRFYYQRGTAKQPLKEGDHAFHWTRLSRRRFRDNEVRLHLLPDNPATFLRCIELPVEMADWAPTSLQLKLIKMGPASSATPAQSPSNWPKWPSPARWCAPSLPPSTDCERHRHARDRDPGPN